MPAEFSVERARGVALRVNWASGSGGTACLHNHVDYIICPCKLSGACKNIKKSTPPTALQPFRTPSHLLSCSAWTPLSSVRLEFHLYSQSPVTFVQRGRALQLQAGQCRHLHPAPTLTCLRLPLLP